MRACASRRHPSPDPSGPTHGSLDSRAELRRLLVEVNEESPELVEALRSELLRPGGLHLADRLTDHADRSGAPGREGDALRAQVVGIGPALEVVEPLELSEQVVQSLLAHPQ